MARSKNKYQSNIGRRTSPSVDDKNHINPAYLGHINPAFLGHRCPQDVLNSIKFHRGTLTEEVCLFLLSNVVNLQVLTKFWSQPKLRSLTSGKAADTICGASWMLSLNHLFLGQIDAARVFMLNGAYIQQCANKPIEEIAAICSDGPLLVSDEMASRELPIYKLAMSSLQTREQMEAYIMHVLPRDYMRRMAFASHAKHTSGSSTWVNEYVTGIGNNWGSSSQHTKPSKPSQGSHIEIGMLNTENGNTVQLSIGVSDNLKELFTKYSEKQGTPLRSLRFAFKGKPLFLSTISKKTPAQLGMSNNDVIHVYPALSSDDVVPQHETISTTLSKKETHGKTMTKMCNSKKRKEHKVMYIFEDHKEQHSRVLSGVFEEAGPRFKAIRQQLNNLTLERTLPKEKLHEKPALSAHHPPLQNLNMAGLAGKAGKSSYTILVGEASNLYKSSKKLQNKVPRSKYIDLHGCTQLEAETILNESLPEWEKFAMEGSYPFVAPVVIVCGGGNQVLSETVSRWIKEHNLSNAPKNMFARAA